MDISEKKFDEINLGETAFFDHEISEEDVRKFAELSGDFNPLHTDEKYAGETEFGKQVVHGFFLGALVSRLIGMRLPGKYALLVKENLEFKNPAFIGDKITVRGTVVHKSPAMKLLEISIEIKTDKILASGTAHVKMLK